MKQTLFLLICSQIIISAYGADDPYWTQCTVGWESTAYTSPTNSQWNPDCNTAPIVNTTIASQCTAKVYACAWLKSQPEKARYQTCAACATGYQLKSTTVSYGGCSLRYNTCEKEDTTVVSCTTTCNDSPWIPSDIKYMQKKKYTCSNKKCVAFQTLYRCAAGYYGINNQSTNKSGCERCPENGNSIPGDNATDTRCFIGGGSTDDTGTYSYISQCYYSH